MSDPMTPRQINQKIKEDKIFWLVYKDKSQLRVYKATSRVGMVYVFTAAGWQRATQLECEGKTVELAAESKPERESVFDRFRSKGETQ